MKTLAIISHTEHYMTKDGQIVGFGATVAEINHLLDIFDHIYHVAMLHEKDAPQNTLAYISDRVTFVPLPPLGGSKLKDKLQLLFKLPEVIATVKRTISKADYFQFRAPTGIGVYVLPYLIWFNSKPGWFKYAGNWKQGKASLAYRFQRWLLTKQKGRKVTINGRWKDQPAQCLSFENPCLTLEELRNGMRLIKTKTLANNQFNLCFVGRLEEAKGIGRLIKGLTALNERYVNLIKVVNVVGEGSAKTQYIEMSKNSGIKYQFLGLLSRTEVHDMFKQSHAIILPSASEGFPKVIAEAMNYGCLPVVSNVSSISEYVEDGVNGFLLQPFDSLNLEQTLERLLSLSNDDYIRMIEGCHQSTGKFTYTHYNQQITSKILM